MSLTIVLNGQQRSLDTSDPLTVLQLVEELGFQPDRVALEQNGAIVPRARWPETAIGEGDRIELVQFVGGGVDVRSSSSRSHRAP